MKKRGDGYVSWHAEQKAKKRTRVKPALKKAA